MASSRTSARASSAKVTPEANQELRNYRLGERVGQDELATFFNATHLTLDRPVVVHILRRTDWVSASRFQLAARLAARLSHPNLLPVLDAGHDDRYGAYLVTPALEARTLDETLAEGPIDPVLALNIAKQIGAALDYLHAEGVIHRDVQPANILVTKQGLAYLTNLSLAASSDTPDLSSVDEADYLTPYSAPEQRLDSSDADPALDIYGLGAVLWHMLSGEIPPPPGDTLPSLGSKDPTLSAAERVLQRMMAPQPQHRFGDAGQAIAALRQALRMQLDRATSDMEESRWEPSAEWLENPLETAIGDLLDQGFISKSRARADGLHRTDVIRRLLDRWSRKGFFRRSPLGQLIEPQQISSYNIYFYELRTTYETRRPPETRTRPQQPREYSSVALPPNIWDVDVPDEDELLGEQELVLPNSMRVLDCPECHGKGKITCKKCDGRGHIDHVRKTKGPNGRLVSETVLETCNVCHGYSNQTCPTCEGVGKVTEEQVFVWSRRHKLWENTDDMTDLPEKALLKRAEPVFSSEIDLFEGRWQSVAPLAELLKAAVDEADEHTRITHAELSISGATLTELDFVLNDKPGRLLLVGHENEVLGDWSLYNFERIALVALGALFVVIVLIWLASWMLG
jgi:Serine/threonine protein kinase